MKLFVYGTLRIGEYNHSYISEHLIQSFGIYKTVLPFYMVRNKGHSFPYVIPPSLIELNTSPVEITGEVYEITEEGQAKIDLLEGIPHHYMREEIIVQNEKERIKANIYLLEDTKYIDIIQKDTGNYFEILKTGDWKQGTTQSTDTQ